MKNAKEALRKFEENSDNLLAMQMVQQMEEAGRSGNDALYDELWRQAELMGQDERINNYFELQENLYARQSKANDMVPSELYRNTAGEIEARDVADRRGMNAQERKNTPPKRGDDQTVFADEGGHWANDESRYDYTKPFAEQVEDYKNGVIPTGDTLMVGPTPSVFQRIGLSALPVTINTAHVDYALNGTKDFDHHLGEALLQQLPEAIKNPIAIMTSGTKSNSIVAMLEIRQNGKQVIVPVAVDGFGKQNGLLIDSNALTSVYGKNYSISKVLYDAIQQEANGTFRLFYLNNKKATALLQKARVPMPKNSATRNDGHIHSIADIDSPVKMKFSGVTETRQFKRWFGDWQNRPQTASQVVNDDGTPRIVYHGTGQSFHVFESDSGAYWFSESEDYAESMMEERGGGEVKAAYLNMRNPYFAALDPGQFSDPTYEAHILRKAKAGGYDGAIITNSSQDPLVADTFYVVFDPNQIKSATENVGTFDGSNADIRYSVDDEVENKPANGATERAR